jgi:hypothetical protein
MSVGATQPQHEEEDTHRFTSGESPRLKRAEKTVARRSRAGRVIRVK